jgi:hypothetical protein
MGVKTKDGYSSQVEIYLLIGGKKIRVAQAGPSRLVLRDLEAIPKESEGELVITVDGREYKRHAFFHEGVAAGEELVEFF